MLYSVATFTFDSDWQRDLFYQQLADIGFEAFDGDQAYIPSELADEEQLNTLVKQSLGVALASFVQCQDGDWNEVWDAEHPLYEWTLHSLQQPATYIRLTIAPHCAFGAGTHQTTAMLIEALQTIDCRQLSVLDNGCGTGVLGIAAALLGATQVTAVDIDNKSVDNTKENALLNKVNITAIRSSTPPKGQYNLILSNIHRNILIEQMPLYADRLTSGGEVWMSGFYTTDIEPIMQAAQKAGLQPASSDYVHQKQEWVMIQCKK